METTAPKTHLGRKIGRIRELRGIKQEALAHELGLSQQTVSRMEASEHVDEETLQKVAAVLGVTPEAIRRFSEEAVFNNINNFHDNSVQNVFNPIEKIVELYERLLQSEREKVELLKHNRGQ